MSDAELMIALWREAGRHLEAIETLPNLGSLLAARLPLRGLRLDECGREQPGLVTLGTWERGGVLRQLGLPRECPAASLAALERWAARGTVDERGAGSRWPPALAAVDPGTEGGASAALPLNSSGRFVGIALLRLDAPLGADARRLLGEAMAPLAAVVDNDFRLREIRRLRERAEAERDSLLHRMGRESLAENVIGAGSGLRTVMQRVEQVARTDATVLLLGETGSGKEVIARTIHERSARCSGPFIRVNCGAVAPELIDSELFGHERGAFTGALTLRRGWFERADGGTLFLDEIGELSAPVQVRLLRVLQDHVVQRVGGEQEHAVDVRVIAATHRDLPVMVQHGRFREDLWYRLAVFPIILPALRERPEDIPALALHFIQRAARRAGLHAPDLDDDGVARLRAYDWPGNVRELGAVLERAVILGQGERLAIEAALGGTVRAPAPEATPPSPARAAAGHDTPAPLDLAIAEHIRRAVAYCGGRIDGAQGAARLLGVNPSTLRSRMRKLGLLRPVPRD